VPSDLHDRHPRPLLARSNWTDLGGRWQFAYDDANAGLAERWEQHDAPFTETIEVPFPPESPASGLGDTGFHPIVWYRRSADLSRPDKGRRLLLHFGAVDYSCDLWVNGRHVGGHRGGQTSYDVDITEQLETTGPQSITLRVVDDPLDLEQPRGKQDWETRPHTIWYDRTTGVWQPVWCEEVPALHITSLSLETGSDNTLDYRIRLSGRPTAGSWVRLRISKNGENLADVSASALDSYQTGTVKLQHPTLDVEPSLLQWSPENPVLLDADISVTTADTANVDEVHSYLGVRTVGTDDNSFLLNGRPYYLRLALHQGFWPESHLAGPSGQALRDEVQWVKTLGFNGVRVHQKVEDPRFLYWCDRLGVVVMADAAAAYTFSPRSVERTVAEWMCIVERDRGHPSIIAWVAFNESWGVPLLDTALDQRAAVRALYHLIKAVDPTRPVIGNDGWEHVIGDLVGIHDYTDDPALITARYATREIADETVRTGRPGGHRLAVDTTHSPIPILLTEFGGATLNLGSGKAWSGYDLRESPQDLLNALEATFDAVHACSGLAGFCYTQLADTQQERNGLLTADRVAKADPAHLAAIICGEPTPKSNVLPPRLRSLE